MKMLLGVVPMVANDLVGESYMSPNLYSEVSRVNAGMVGKNLSSAGGTFSSLFSAKGRR